MQIGGNLITLIGLFSVCGTILIALLATWPSTKAYEKGRNFFKWYIFSLLLFPIAIVAAYLIKGKPIEPDNENI